MYRYLGFLHTFCLFFFSFFLFFWLDLSSAARVLLEMKTRKGKKRKQRVPKKRWKFIIAKTSKYVVGDRIEKRREEKK